MADNHINYLTLKIIYVEKRLLELFFRFYVDYNLGCFSCRNRIILIRFWCLFMWFRSCCTQIVPKKFSWCFFYIVSPKYFSFPNVSSSNSAAIFLSTTRIKLSSASSLPRKFMLPYQTISRSTMQ